MLDILLKFKKNFLLHTSKSKWWQNDLSLAKADGEKQCRERERKIFFFFFTSFTFLRMCARLCSL